MNKKILANLLVCLMLTTLLTVCCSVEAKSKKIDKNPIEGNGSITVVLKFSESLKDFPHVVWCNLQSARPQSKNANGDYYHTFTNLDSGVYTVTSALGPTCKATTRVVTLSDAESITVNIDINEKSAKSYIKFLEIFEIFNLKSFYILFS